MLIKIFVRTFSSTEDCELFELILETRWPNLLQQVKGVRFRAMKNPQTPNVSVVLWEFPDAESMKKIDKLIDENIAKYVKTLSPKTIHFVGGVTQDFGETIIEEVMRIIYEPNKRSRNHVPPPHHDSLPTHPVVMFSF